MNMSRPCKLEGDTARRPHAVPGKYPTRAAPHVTLLLRPVVGAQRPCNWVRSSRLRVEQSPLPLAPAVAAQKPQLAHLHQRWQCAGAHQVSQEGTEASRESLGTQLALVSIGWVALLTP